MKLKIYVTLILAFVGSVKVFAQDNICTELNKASIQLHQDSTYQQFSFLDSTLKNVNILALGESSHGTHEFFTSKFEVIKYCVLNLNYKVFGVESDYAGTELANEYITTGKGTAQSAVFNMGISAWMTAEMRDILDWLKEYNRNQSDFAKVRLFGFDMQYSAFALNQLKATLTPLGFASIAYIDTVSTWKTAKQINNGLLEQLSSDVLRFAAKQNPQVQTKLEGLVRAMEKAVTYLSITDQHQRENFRDQLMYENTLEFYGKNRNKMIIWAHNEHITKASNFKSWNTMGHLLYKDLRDKYYAMGLMTIEGKVGFKNLVTKTGDSVDIPVDTKKSFESFLAECGSPYFYIDIQRAITINANLAKYLNQVIQTFTIDLTYNAKKREYVLKKNYFKNRIADKFDGVLFIRTTAASRH